LQKGKNILICPLEWGLGHAGRMIPLAKKLIDLGQNVIIGSGPGQLEFFRQEIPGITCISFPGFTIRYSSWIPQYLVILLHAPAFIYHSIREHRQLKRIIAYHSIDIVISDSRPGLWNRKIKTVFVTHMIRIPLPGWAAFIEKRDLFTTRRIIRKFTYCYIPDTEGEVNLSGKLSHKISLPSNARYIGILSRFSDSPSLKEDDHRYYCTAVMSGPEPQKGIMKKKISEILSLEKEDSVILEGKPGVVTRQLKEGNILFISHLPADEMKKLILSSRFIVSRSGYTTLMELASLGRPALIIPTPGQTEQEYLAEYLHEKGWFTTVKQNEMAPGCLQRNPDCSIPGTLARESEKLLEAALSELLEQDHK
jgi:UDP:flavonoid glycosyltransferase YjiC (YdhE family)